MDYKQFSDKLEELGGAPAVLCGAVIFLGFVAFVLISIWVYIYP